MKVIVAKATVRTLVLNEEESTFLADLTRNYLGDGEESKKSSELRARVFNSVTRDINGEAEYK